MRQRSGDESPRIMPLRKVSRATLAELFCPLFSGKVLKCINGTSQCILDRVSMLPNTEWPPAASKQ